MIIIIVRCFIIAVRYGFSSDLRYNMLKEQVHNQDFLDKDLLGVSWLNPKANALMPEVEATMWRN